MDGDELALQMRSEFGERQAIAAALQKAGGTSADKLIAAFRGLSFDTPFGTATFRAQDHQSTLGAFVGRTAVVDGKGTMVDFRYVDGADVQPSDEEVANMRSSGK